MSEEQQKESFFAEVLKSETMNVRCNGCGTDQVMNVVYAKYVKEGLSTCSNCRNRNK